MTSVGIGIPINAPGGYDVIAEYAIRLTPTGEFIHVAPWAYYRIGKWNGSHGCTNMFIPDARWLFVRVLPGDVTIMTGTTYPMTYWNGQGAVWNMPWPVWLRGSALR
jgi:lipoprotein-anchoring transpeptidase ErfK/SrfK